MQCKTNCNKSPRASFAAVPTGRPPKKNTQLLQREFSQTPVTYRLRTEKSQRLPRMGAVGFPYRTKLRTNPDKTGPFYFTGCQEKCPLPQVRDRIYQAAHKPSSLRHP